MRYHLLDAFRGIAALWVVLHHYNFGSRLTAMSPWIASICEAGRLGVPMFFVISGFCLMASAMSSQVRSEPTSSFLYRRLRRIYPPFWLSVVVGVSLPFLLESISLLKTGSFSWPTADEQPFLNFSPVHWIEIVTLTRAFAPLPDATLIQKFSGFNNVYWSLAIEVQFYLVVASCLLMRSRFWWLMAAMTLAAIICLPVPGVFESGLFLPYWPAFALGAALYLLLRLGLTSRKCLGEIAGGGTGVCVAFAGLLIASKSSLSENSQFLVFSAVFAIFLWFLHGFDEWLIDSDHHATLRVPVALCSILGMFSYSIYLLHAKFFHLADVVGRQIPGDSLTEDFLRIVLTILFCVPFYWFCERPFAQSLSRKPTLDVDREMTSDAEQVRSNLQE